MSSGSRQDAEERRNNVARNVTFGKSSEHCRPHDGLAYVRLQSFLVGHLWRTIGEIHGVPISQPQWEIGSKQKANIEYTFRMKSFPL
jgi:uncharacterized protein (DUF779 family)